MASSNTRESGTNPKALGTNPRAKGTNPRALGTNPRANQQCDTITYQRNGIPTDFATWCITSATPADRNEAKQRLVNSLVAQGASWQDAGMTVDNILHQSSEPISNATPHSTTPIRMSDYVMSR